jgi:DNA polymerase III sliding clamp (beta) subunit (PCNA family)
VEGNPITLASNVNYLLDAARSIDTEQVIMEFQPGISPAVLRPDADEDHLCIVMPMTQVD